MSPGDIVADAIVEAVGGGTTGLLLLVVDDDDEEEDDDAVVVLCSSPTTAATTGAVPFPLNVDPFLDFIDCDDGGGGKYESLSWLSDPIIESNDKKDKQCKDDDDDDDAVRELCTYGFSMILKSMEMTIMMLTTMIMIWWW